MARIRSIHPDACDSDKLARLSDSAERCFWRLITYLDDEGRCEDRPKLMAAKLFPLNDEKGEQEVEDVLAELADVGLVVRYIVGGRCYIAVPTFGDWQSPRHPTASQHPSPDDAEARLTSHRRNLTAERSKADTDRRDAHAGGGEGDGGGEGAGEIHDDDADASPSPFSTSEQSSELAAEADGQAATAPEQPDPVDLQFVDFWDRYPRHHTSGKPGGGGSRKKALQRWRNLTQRQRDQALAAVDNYRGWCERDDGEFAAHATTWLNEERWEQWQQPAPPPSSSNGATPRAGPRPAGHEPNPSDEPVTARRVQP
jgi:hypothetical protein